MGETGYVVGIEHMPKLVEQAEKNLRKESRLYALLDRSGHRPGHAIAPAHAPHAAHAPDTQTGREARTGNSSTHSVSQAAGSSGALSGATGAHPNMLLVCGDGRAGYPPAAPYDAIHVGAAALEIPYSVCIHLHFFHHPFYALYALVYQAEQEDAPLLSCWVP